MSLFCHGHLRPLLPGLLLALALSLLALLLAGLPLAPLHTLGPLTLAMLLGLAAGHLARPHWQQRAAAGLQFSRQRLLRTGILLYGLRIAPEDLAQAGVEALLLDLVVVAGILTAAAWIGTRWLQLDLRSAILIGAGSAICGAAAVLASAPAVRAREPAVPVAIATVVLFGSLALLLYPWLFAQLGQWPLLPADAVAFGRLVGATTHEVAQVTAIAAQLPAEAAHAAVVTKLMRVMLLVPVLLILQPLFGRSSDAPRRLPIPWFALAFLLLPFVHSFAPLPPAVQVPLQQLDQLLLAMAMAALGCATRLAAIRAAGWRPLALGALLFVLLLMTGGSLSWLLG